MSVFEKFEKFEKLVFTGQESSTPLTVLWLTGLLIEDSLIGFSFCALQYKKWLEEVCLLGGIESYFNTTSIKLRELTKGLQECAILNTFPNKRLIKKLGTSLGLFLIGYNQNTDNIVLVPLEGIPIVPSIKALEELNTEI